MRAGTPPIIGLFGKIPRNGDFVRRGLPDSFVEPWDRWLRDGMTAAREELGPAFAELYPQSPSWFFRLSAGACGPSAAAGVLVPSRDAVGRLFPVTVAKLIPDGAPAPEAGWYPATEAAARSALERLLGADLLLEAVVAADEASTLGGATVPAEGWWTSAGRELGLAGLPPSRSFILLLREDE